MSKESELRNRIAELEGQLEEAEQTLSAIRNGEVDAFVISGSAGQQIYTLTGADHTYRILVEDMREGAITLSPDGLLLYSNASFANLVRSPLGRVIGSHLSDYLTEADGDRLLALCRAAGKGEVTIKDAAGGSVPVYVSFNQIAADSVRVLCLVVTDLTEQKRAHEILVSETLARGILDQAAEAVVVADTSGIIIRASRAARALAGGDILLRQFEDAFPFTVSGPCGAAAQAARSFIQTACEGATVRGCDAVLTRASGETAYLLASAAPLLGSEGECLGAVATLTDLTAHRKVEEQLRKSEEERRLAVDAAGIGTWALDLNRGRFVGCEQCAALLGLGTVRDLPVAEFFMLVHPEDRERARAELFEALADPSSDFYREFEYRSVWPDGSTHWISTRGRLELDASGAPASVRGIALNIDAAKRMEKELREAGETVNAIIAGAPAAIWLVDADGRIALWNPAASRLFGYTPEEVLAKAGLFHVETPAPAVLLSLLEAGEVLVGSEAICAHKNGSRIDVSLSTSALRNPDGSYRGFVAIALDITEQKRMEEHLRQTQKLESVGLLAGGVAHDFNNLLTGILGNASLLAETVSRQDRPRVDEIMDASERAASLTRQLLAYAGKGQFVLQALDLSAVVQALLPLLRTSLPRKADIRLELQDGLPPVHADRSQLEQVIMNLVINAGEAMGDAAGIITVVTRSRYLPPEEAQSRGLQPGLYVCLEVTDTGCGMDDATRDRLFEPFFTTKFMGRGLGLAAVHGIVRSSKGSIRVESQQGAGTQFEVVFPAFTRSAAPAEQPSAVTARGSGVVLVVDDEEVVRSTAEAALMRYGFTVITAANGQEAVDRFREAPDLIDAVLLDVKMPVMGGREALRELRQIRPELKVIISSGYNEAEALRDFSSEGVNLFVQKPYTAAALAAALRCVIEPDASPGSQ